MMEEEALTSSGGSRISRWGDCPSSPSLHPFLLLFLPSLPPLRTRPA